jgi:DNA-binding NarL/FixJ family response regulator
MIRIAVISGQEHDRESIIAVLAEHDDFSVVCAGIDSYDAVKTAQEQQPDVIIIDLGIKDGTDIVPVIKRFSPQTKIIMVYSPGEPVCMAFKTDISGCLLKQGEFDSLGSSVLCAYYGGLFFSRPVRDHALRLLGKTKEKNACAGTGIIAEKMFSFTEMRIFFGIILGQTDKEIAKNLNITTGALRNCITHVKEKTRLRNRTQMAIFILTIAMMSRKNIQGQFADS